MEKKIEETSGTTAPRGEVYCVYTYFCRRLAESNAEDIRDRGYDAYTQEPSEGRYEVWHEKL